VSDRGISDSLRPRETAWRSMKGRWTGAQINSGVVIARQKESVMSTKVMKEIQDLIAPNLRKRLYVAFSYPTATQEEMLPHIPEHLRYMEANEDRVFISGPFVKESQLAGEAMTIILTDREVTAAEFMRNEPFVKRGLRRFELKLWEMCEGTLTVSTRLSDSSFSLK
jgi:uncharacterized protein YciI